MPDPHNPASQFRLGNVCARIAVSFGLVKPRRIAAAISIVLLTAAVLTACSPSGPTPHKIGLLLPDTVSSRYATDRSEFTAEVARLDPSAKVTYGNADGNAGTQEAQAVAMLKSGVTVLVLDPYDVRAAVYIVARAKAKHVPVIDYDSLISGSGSTYYVGYDDVKAGELQATAFVSKLKAQGVATGSGILLVNGSASASVATLTAKGAHSVIDASGYTVLAEYQTPGGVPSFASTWVQARISQFGSKIQGVYAANDGLAAGVLAATTAAKVDPTTLALTGRGASFSAIQNLLADTQQMTLYAPIKPEAVKAATLAVELLAGTHRSAPDAVPSTSGGTVPSFLLTPVVVTKTNIQSTVIKDGFDKVERICTRAFAAKCTAQGIH